MSTDQNKVTRKLRAILSADVKGYSILMADDEVSTVQTLKDYQRIMSNYIGQHGGRVVDAVGDNLLAEFGSVVDAVQCAVEIQKKLNKKNEDVPENKRLQFRIGVNIGDVIQDGDRIFGDGVNIAARIEGLAEAGGVCISRNAYDHIRTKLDLGYEYLGDHSVKNISQPVRVYKVLLDPADSGKLLNEKPRHPRKKWFLPVTVVAAIIVTSIAWYFYQKTIKPDIEPASVEEMAYPLPDKPSIAVLPFDNMSGDPEQEYFSDGITEEIITALSKTPKILVIARNSTFTYKGKAIKINQVSEDLGVQYVLEGSVRKAGDKIRVTAQLIDALTGHHLWAETYDRELKDIFSLQDEITIKIVGSLRVELTDGELARFLAKGTENLQAYLKLLQSREPFYTSTKEGNARARQLCEEAISIDPEYAAAYVYLGASHWVDISLGASKSSRESFKRAFESIQKALRLNESLPEAHSQMGGLYLMTGQHDKSLAASEQALKLAPNSANAYIWMGIALKFSGRHEEAVRYIEQALRLDPLPPRWYLRAMGSAYAWVGRYEEAFPLLHKAVQGAPNDLLNYIALCTSHYFAGHIEEARIHASKVIRINPKYSIQQAVKTIRYKNKEDRERFVNALRMAGLPEKPPLPLPDKPSIAVLAFDNLSGDPEQEYFSDGLTEDIITAFSKVPEIFVIARNSTFTYKGKPVKVQKVAEDLGVRYILEGSVRKSQETLRITAQLIDALTGHHLWAESYDRELKDIFAVQDEITMEILNAMEVKLTHGEQARLLKKGTNNLNAYLKFLQGMHYIRHINPENNLKARWIFENLITQEPNYAFAYSGLATTYLNDAWLGTTRSKEESLKRAVELSKKALSVDESHAVAYTIIGSVLGLKKDWDQAVSLLYKSVELNPNYAANYRQLGVQLCFADRPEEAIPILQKALRLNPIAPPDYFNYMAIAYRMTGQYDIAIEYLEKGTQRYPDHLFSHLNLSACYILAGREQEACAETKEVLRLNPKFTVDQFDSTLKLKNQEEKKRFIGALRKAFSCKTDL